MTSRLGSGPLSRMGARELFIVGETLYAGEGAQHPAERKLFEPQQRVRFGKFIAMGSRGAENFPDSFPNPHPGHGPGSSHVSQTCVDLLLVLNVLVWHQ